MDKQVIAAMFSDENYRVKKDINRFSTKQLEGLVYLLNKTTDFIDQGITALRNYRWEGSDGKKLYDHITPHIVDLACTKTLVENIINMEPKIANEDLKKFNAKTVITNIVDWISKDIRSKEIGLSLVFSNDFPQQIHTRYNLLRALCYNVVRYIERKLQRGSILIYCDCERVDEQENEEIDKGNLYIKFTFKVESLRESDLPLLDFLTFAPTFTSTPAAQISVPRLNFDVMEEKIPAWLTQLKEQLRFVISVTNRPKSGNEMA